MERRSGAVYRRAILRSLLALAFIPCVAAAELPKSLDWVAFPMGGRGTCTQIFLLNLGESNEVAKVYYGYSSSSSYLSESITLTVPPGLTVTNTEEAIWADLATFDLVGALFFDVPDPDVVKVRARQVEGSCEGSERRSAEDFDLLATRIPVTDPVP